MSDRTPTEARPRAALVTGPPHVRSSLAVAGVLRCVGVAALPCVAAGIYNAGFQARAAHAAGLGAGDGWPFRALEVLGVSASSTRLWVCAVHGAAIALPLFAAALLGGGFAKQLFARLRGREVDATGLGVIALLFTLCLPPTLPLWQAALGGFLALAVGTEMFGGYGRGFVNPPLVGLAFLYFAYPSALSGDAVWVAVDGYSGATPLAAAQRGGLAALEGSAWGLAEAVRGDVPGALGATSVGACALGLAVLLYTGVASWRVVVGALLGLVAAALALSSLGLERPIAELPWHWHAVSGGFAFGIVFLATDPATAAATNPGRWLYGLTIGALVVVLRVTNPAHRESVLLAILLGNVLAPLLDQIAARVQMRRGRTPHAG